MPARFYVPLGLKLSPEGFCRRSLNGKTAFLRKPWSIQAPARNYCRRLSERKLLHSPKLLILDEPTSGLDSLIKRRFKDLLVEENQKGATIFFCNHDIGEVQELCGRTAIIRKGSILEVANTDNLSSSDTRRVKLKTTDNLSALFTLFQINDPVVTGDLVTFSYRGVMDPFIKALANYEIQDLQVSLPSLEDAIIRFYEKKLEQEAADHA